MRSGLLGCDVFGGVGRGLRFSGLWLGDHDDVIMCSRNRVWNTVTPRTVQRTAHTHAADGVGQAMVRMQQAAGAVGDGVLE